MVEGGRNLEEEVMESFFEEVERDDSIPDGLREDLEELESREDLTDDAKVVDATREALADAHSEDRS